MSLKLETTAIAVLVHQRVNLMMFLPTATPKTVVKDCKTRAKKIQNSTHQSTSDDDGWTTIPDLNRIRHVSHARFFKL